MNTKENAMVKMNNLSTSDRHLGDLDCLKQQQIKGGFFTHSHSYDSKGKSDFVKKYSFDLNGKKMLGISTTKFTKSGGKIVNQITKSSGGKVIINGEEM